MPLAFAVNNALSVTSPPPKPLRAPFWVRTCRSTRQLSGSALSSAARDARHLVQEPMYTSVSPTLTVIFLELAVRAIEVFAALLFCHHSGGVVSRENSWRRARSVSLLPLAFSRPFLHALCNCL